MFADLFSSCRAVIFDLDGTLIDSLPLWNEVDQELWIALCGRKADPHFLAALREKALRDYCRDPDPYLRWCELEGKACGSPLPAREIHRMRYAISRRFLRSRIGLRPGADQVVKQCAKAGKKLAIATTTRRRNVDIYCDENEIIRAQLKLREWFSVILTMEDVVNIKPDPEIYQKTSARLGVSPQQCLVFEDSLAGVCAARSAGMRVAALDESSSREEQKQIQKLADCWFCDFSGVLQLLVGEERMN